MRYSDLCWPERLNLGILSKILSEKLVGKIIEQYADKPLSERTIVLPSRLIIRKCVGHHLGQLVSEGQMTWTEAMRNLKGGFKLKDLNLTRKQMKRFHRQRSEEILREEKK